MAPIGYVRFSVTIREQTTCLIGRLSVLNPAYIMPTLRKTLYQLLTEMEYSGNSRNKEQSARMIGHLVANAPTVIRPYVDPILKAENVVNWVQIG